MKVSSGSLPEVAVVVSWIFQRFAGGRTSGLRGTCSNHVPVARTGWWLETFFSVPMYWKWWSNLTISDWYFSDGLKPSRKCLAILQCRLLIQSFGRMQRLTPQQAGAMGWPFFHTPSGRTWYAVLNRWFLGELHDFGGSWSVWCVEVYRAGIPWALLDSIHLCMVHDSEICLWSALHEMHSVVPIRYGSKSIPPKMDWLPFLWIVLYPILTHTQFDFYLVQSGSLRLWGGGKISS